MFIQLEDSRANPLILDWIFAQFYEIYAIRLRPNLRSVSYPPQN